MFILYSSRTMFSVNDLVLRYYCSQNCTYYDSGLQLLELRRMLMHERLNFLLLLLPKLFDTAEQGHYISSTATWEGYNIEGLCARCCTVNKAMQVVLLLPFTHEVTVGRPWVRVFRFASRNMDTSYEWQCRNDSTCFVVSWPFRLFETIVYRIGL